MTDIRDPADVERATPRLDPHRPRPRVEIDPLHLRKVNGKAPFRQAVAAGVVPPGPHADREAVFPGEPDGPDHVLRPEAAHQDGRTGGDGTVEERARRFVAVRLGREQRAAELRRELRESLKIRHDPSPRVHATCASWAAAPTRPRVATPSYRSPSG